MLVCTQSGPVETEQRPGGCSCINRVGNQLGELGLGAGGWPLSTPRGEESYLRTFLLSTVESSSESDPSSALLSMIFGIV